tara:strand:+ start:8999 stop:9604 length:606 start_codon:yes stop_codon:yes gene_type:complete
MLIGYARTSTLDQKAGFESQLSALEAVGCDKVYKEQVSSVDVKERRELQLALDQLRTGDFLVVTKLDRLARSVPHLLELLEGIQAKDAGLRILDINIDTSTPTGKLMLTVLGSVAAFEREIMLERQREGIAKAKAAGKYKGRKPTAMAKAAEVKRLQAEGIGATEIASRLGIGRASVYRVLGAKESASEGLDGVAASTTGR